MQEQQLTSIIQLPCNPALWELALVGNRRTGQVLSHTGGVDHDRARRQRLHQAIVKTGIGVAVVLKFDVRRQGISHGPQDIEPGLRPIDDDHASSPVGGILSARQMHEERRRRSPRSGVGTCADFSRYAACRAELLTAAREFRVAAGDPAFCARTAFLRAGSARWAIGDGRGGAFLSQWAFPLL